MRTDRRRFLKKSLAASTLVSMGTATVPTFLAHSARARMAHDEPPAATDRVLVVVQMLGGNDGLNTVVPFRHDGYSRGRRALRLPTSQLQKINDEIGLHPGMGRLAGLLENNRLAILQGVGYPNPDRSHFRSMEIWETARVENTPDALESGWLGRYLDSRPPVPGEDLPALQVDSRSRLALRSNRMDVPSLESLEQYRLQVSGDAVTRRATGDAIGDVARIRRPEDNALLGFLRRSTLAAYDSSRRLEQIAKDASGTEYPNFRLADRLKLIAQIIKAGFGTKIFYTTLDGFDTHANQLGTHAALLTELSDSLAAFHDDLAKAGQADRVCVLSFSEFGRRVAENASAGTDHGAAAPVFVMGPVAKAGLVGTHPSLEELDDGDLKYHTDFRRIYSTFLEHWLGQAASTIVGEGFPPLDFLPKPT